jgi:hypothetical protein
LTTFLYIDKMDSLNDPAFLHAFWLLTQIPLAARGPAFAEDLRRLGLEVSDQPSLLDVAAAFSGAVDRYARQRGGRTCAATINLAG